MGGGVTGKKFNPTPYLFVANLTEDIDERDVRDAFKEHGFEVIEFARKRLEFGIVSLQDTNTAVHALIEMHSTVLRDLPSCDIFWICPLLCPSWHSTLSV